MTLSPTSSHGGGATSAQVATSGLVLPAAGQVGATVDTTTYDNTITGVGKLRTLVYAADTAALAIALTGDAFPRIILTSDGTDGMWMGDGTFDCYTNGAGWESFNAGAMHLLCKPGKSIETTEYAHTNLGITALGQVTPVARTTSGALSTVQLVSGTGASPYAGSGDTTARDVETHTVVTFNPGAATIATCKVELSPDNVTYSTLCIWTEPAGVALDGTIHDVTCRVPAGWFLKLTVSATAVLGLTTYY